MREVPIQLSKAAETSSIVPPAIDRLLVNYVNQLTINERGPSLCQHSTHKHGSITRFQNHICQTIHT